MQIADPAQGFSSFFPDRPERVFKTLPQNFQSSLVTERPQNLDDYGPEAAVFIFPGGDLDEGGYGAGKAETPKDLGRSDPMGWRLFAPGEY